MLYFTLLLQRLDLPLFPEWGMPHPGWDEPSPVPLQLD